MYKNKANRNGFWITKRKVSKKSFADFSANYVTKTILFILLIIILFAPNNSVLARDKSVFNIDWYYGWGGYFRPMEWTPVEITVNNSLKKPFNGEFTLSSQQDGLNTLNIIVPEFVLTPEAPKYSPLVTKMAFTSQGCNFKLDRVDGRRRKTVWSHNDNTLRNMGRNPVIDEYDMLIGVVGAGKFGILRLEKQSVCQFKNIDGNVYIGNKQVKMVPWDWTGFASLDMLILYDPDWTLFREQQLKAIGEWISNGGKLLLVLGSRPPMGDNPLMDMIPFDYLEAKQVSISPQQLYDWNLTGEIAENVTLRPVVSKESATFYKGDIYQDNQYLFAVGNVGFGTVGVLGFDPEELSDIQDVQSSRFWINMIHAVTETENSMNNTILAQRRIRFVQDSTAVYDQSGRPVRNIQPGNQNYYQIGNAYSLNNKVMEFLYQEIKPLSVWFVIFLLGALAVLLGPVDYKILKSIDRLPLTWLTCSFWIILFTVGAYYGVQYLRGGKMQLRVVTVIDGIKDYDKVWETQYSGLFASKSDSYELEGTKQNQWWSGIAPTQDQVYYYNNEMGSRRIYCVQEEGGNMPEAIPVNIWDIQCMLTESTIDEMPFSADVEQFGDEVVVTIKNDSDAEIINGYVLTQKRRGITFGNIPANSVQEFRKKSQSLSNWESDIQAFTQVAQYSGSRSSSSYFKNEAAFFAQGSLQRTQAINNYLNKGAIVVCVTYHDAPVSFGVKNHSVNNQHIQLARLVIFPK